mgnify:CR=1 FL=1
MLSKLRRVKMSDYCQDYMFSTREEKLSLLMDMAKTATPDELIIINNEVKKVLQLPSERDLLCS